MDIQLTGVDGAVPFREAVKTLRAQGRKCSHLSLWRFVRRRDIPVYRIGNCMLVRLEALADYRHGDDR